MTTPVLQAIDLCRYFRRGKYEVRAVDGVTLAIEAGEFVSLVGASGCGKSTLLALLAGLDTPTSGHIEYLGASLGDMSRRQLAEYRAAQIGVVFQSFNLVPHRTALQNVELALYFSGFQRTERKRRAAHTLERLGMGDRLDHRPADLSGGEQQRVAIGRALVKEPQIVFADEPTGNLDQDHTMQIAELLKELNATGKTIVMVTHNLDLAQDCSSRLIRLDYGRISEASRT
ncbi:MAG: ABC transporter ATP-binding protein [Candidatus Zixiibacteriota bacterium]|nr:MAG: ABC transporter ATP-binding protein [candidate division Zixibacteria bacterium]